MIECGILDKKVGPFTVCMTFFEKSLCMGAP